MTLDGFLRPLPPSFLLSVLPSVLSSLPLPADIAHPGGATKKKDKGKGKELKPSVPAAAAAVQAVHAEALEADLLDALDAVECGNEDVARELLGWFGEPVEVGGKKRWRLDAAQLVKELGVVLLAEGGVSHMLFTGNREEMLTLRPSQFGQQPHDAFLAKWKSLAGGFAPVCALSLLAVRLHSCGFLEKRRLLTCDLPHVQGLHLYRPPPVSTVQYLPPSSLSPDPAARFAELFSLKPRWLEADMSVYIDDLTGGDKKKRDALVLKFVRKVKDKDTTWWTARNLWTS